MLSKIDDLILSAVAALVIACNRRLGVSRHVVIRESITLQVLAAFGSALLIATFAQTVVVVAYACMMVLMQTDMPARWKEADGRARVADTYEGWQSDMELTAIHNSIRTSAIGRTYLLVDLLMIAAYGYFFFVMAGRGYPYIAAVPCVIGVRHVANMVARYVLSVPPPPPGAGRSERVPHGVEA